MSSVSPAQLGRASGLGGSLDFELNLAPVIDCLTVLIGFVMISVVFASVRILDIGVGAGAMETTAQKSPSVKVVVELAATGMMQIKVTGKESLQVPVRN